MAQVLLTTQNVGSYTVDDLGGKTFVHPVVDFDLLTEFTETDIQESEDLQSLIDSGDIVLEDTAGNVLGTVRDIGAHKHNLKDDVDQFTLADLNDRVSDGTLDTTSDPRPPNAHAGSHIQGATDEIDGDQIDIDFTPANYTPDTSPPEVDDLDQLTAHLKGIDDALNGVAGNEKYIIRFGRNRNNSADVYLNNEEVPSNIAGSVLAVAGTLTHIAVKTESPVSCTFEIRKNGSPTVLESITLTAQDLAVKAVNVAFSAQDEVQVYLNGTCDRVVLLLSFTNP